MKKTIAMPIVDAVVLTLAMRIERLDAALHVVMPPAMAEVVRQGPRAPTGGNIQYRSDPGHALPLVRGLSHMYQERGSLTILTFVMGKISTKELSRFTSKQLHKGADQSDK